MTKPATLARVITSAVTASYTVVLYITHSSITGMPARILSLVPTVIGVGLLVFDLWAWRWPLVRRVVARPRIDGRWFGTLQPNPESKIPSDGNRGPVQAALVIEQTYWSVGITLMTVESTSNSTSSSLRSDQDSPGRRTLAYTYLNEPKQVYRSRSPAHAGACRLRVVGLLPSEMEGDYWTARLTAGDMTFVLVDRDVDSPNFETISKAASAKGKGAPTA